MKLKQPTPGQLMSQEQPPQPKVSWIDQLYQRAPWIKAGVRYGQRVLPQNQQSSNISLSDEQVMHRRNEPVRQGSVAFPLNTMGERNVTSSPGKGRHSTS